MTQMVLNIENPSAASALRSLVKNMIGVTIASESRRKPKVKQEEDLTQRICDGLKEVKLMESGAIPSKSAWDLLNEL